MPCTVIVRRSQGCRLSVTEEVVSVAGERWLLQRREVWPGLLVAILVAMAAAFLGSHYKSSVLRIGVALLGLHLTIEHVAALAG